MKFQNEHMNMKFQRQEEMINDLIKSKPYILNFKSDSLQYNFSLVM